LGNTNKNYRRRRKEMKRFLQYLLVKGIVIALVSTGAIAEDRLASTNDEAVPTTAPRQASYGSFTTFKNYPDGSFHLKVKEYINGMKKGGHNLLIWRDPGSNLSPYSSVKVAEFGGRLLPQQNGFSYDPFVALFNSVFRSSIRLRQEDSPDSLLIEGAVVECNPGSRAARVWVGMGAGRAGGAVVCEIYEPGKPNPCIRIYTRDTSAAGGNWGGDSNLMLNNILSTVATRLAGTLNTTVVVR
jgi:Domain of unknown function (DUF4410)